MAARQFEETRDIGDIVRLGTTLPGEASIQPELAALPDGADDADIGHMLLL
jgi:hypothetical protein